MGTIIKTLIFIFVIIAEFLKQNVSLSQLFNLFLFVYDFLDLFFN